MRLWGILFQSEHLCIYQKWHLHKFAEKIKRQRKIEWEGETSERERGREESNGWMWFTVSLVARVRLLGFRSHNSRSYSFYLFICLCKPTQMGTRHFSPLPDISWRYDIFSPTLSEPMSGIHTIFLHILTLFSFSSTTWHNLFLHYASLIAKIPFNDYVCTDTDLTRLADYWDRSNDTNGLLFSYPLYERFVLT